MKNFVMLLILLMPPVVSVAQFKAGQIFFGGGANFSLSNDKYEGNTSSDKFTTYSHNLDYSSGYFTDDNRAIGWTLGQSLFLNDYGQQSSSAFAPRKLRSISFSGRRFVEHYKSLSDKLALFVRPGFGLTYQLQNDDSGQDGNVRYTKRQTNTFILGINVSGGIAWALSPKWALYGGFAFANPINISAGWNNTETASNTFPGSNLTDTKGGFFRYSFSPALSSGSVNLGFRYLIVPSSTF